MKLRKPLLVIFLILTLTGIAFGLYAKVKAHKEVVEYLKEQFAKQNIPLAEITISSLIPLRLEINIKSLSESEKALPTDTINLYLVRRDVILARQQGYPIESFTLTLLNNQGKTIFWAETPVDAENLPTLLPPSNLDDVTTNKMVEENLNLYGMSLKDSSIYSSDRMQTLVLRLTAASLEEANQAIPLFIPAIRPVLTGINAQGAQIVICIVEVADGKGQLLLEYLIDLQQDSETWWMVDGLTQDWFPHPPP